ncbi:sulfite exporter TauE/SafE family protein [Celeribacter baekdonensis]|uniref:sulfite exporter TauE/SafE family protein n=1 Tax=Celeribacter baekdonensis TaxID=875171 RepID=UPI0030D6DCF3
MDGTAFWIAAIAASIFVGMGKGGLPMIGMMGVPILSLVIDPVVAAGLLLPVYVVSDMFGLVAYRRDFDKRVLMIVVPGMIAGIGLAWALASEVPEWAVVTLVGLIGFVFSLNTLLRRKRDLPARKAEVAPGLFWGTVTGFTSFVVHSGAPPFQVYTLPLKLPKTVFAGTATIAFAIGNGLKLIPYYALGQLTPTSLKTAALLAVPASIAVFAGLRLVRVIPEVLFYKIVTWALLALSLKLIWDGVAGV